MRLEVEAPGEVNSHFGPIASRLPPYSSRSWFYSPRLLSANDSPSSSIAMFTVLTVTSDGTEI